jgi:hypothetical protein
VEEDEVNEDARSDDDSGEEEGVPGMMDELGTRR